MDEVGHYISCNSSRFLLFSKDFWVLNTDLLEIITNIKILTNGISIAKFMGRELFAENRRFPPKGKYVRIGGPGSAWFQVIIDFNSTDKEESRIKIIEKMREMFCNEVGTYDRKSFEEALNIQWQDPPIM
ncbi:uncharacterized protein LOC123293497 [Chrysoperla carnea]|uniref:uncharacterized protein LOC123293497 n=1 Tax=Chrysoperla carnea TaxID=189513 RepID=UPI001D08DD51|nr:uncharacterized protein LOC123293497 [Chrysoperla carnea]